MFRDNQNKRELLKALNQRLRKCTNCALSDTRENVLVGEGDPDARLMLIALAPGEKENAGDKMFIGPSGQVLNRLFTSVGIDRQSVYMTNLIKCMLPKNRRPKMAEIETCGCYLNEEVSIVKPEILVPLGYYATRYILTKYNADPPEAREDYTNVFGRLLFQDNQKIYPLPHPAALIYNPSLEPEATRLYGKLTVFLHVCKWYSVCPMKQFYEDGRLEQKWVELYCKGNWSGCVRYEMEKQGRLHPDWMLPDGSLDEKLEQVVNRSN